MHAVRVVHSSSTELERRLARRTAESASWQQLAEHLQREIDLLGVRTLGDLHACLSGDRPEETVAAACSLVGYLGDRRSSVPRLARVLVDTPVDGIRCEAAKALAVLDGALTLRLLAPVVRGHPDPSARAWATYALALGTYEGVTDVLLEAAADQDEDPAVRENALEGLAYHVPYRRRRRVLPTLLAGLHDPAGVVRFWACFALASVGSAKEIAALELLLDDRSVPVHGSWSVRREARWAIETIQYRMGMRTDHPDDPEYGDV